MGSFVLLAALSGAPPAVVVVAPAPPYQTEARAALALAVATHRRGVVVQMAPAPLVRPYAAPVCVGGVCSVPQASAPLENGWYPGKLLGRRR